MEQIVKQTREVGTSAGVLLPRAWLNKEVVVTLKGLSREEISRRVIDILLEKRLLQDVKGIYLAGSYARGEQDFSSDIDILIITGKTNKLIDAGDYEIILVSEDNLKKNFKKSLYYFSMIKEAKIIVNNELIQKYKQELPNINIRELGKEISQIIGINKDIAEICRSEGKNVPDGIIYSSILRLRELGLVRNFYDGKSFDWKNLKKKIGEKAYRAYVRIKRNEREVNDVSAEEVLQILELAEKWLKGLKELKKARRA